MGIEITTRNGTSIIHLQGRINFENAKDIQKKMTDAADKSENVVVNCDKLEYVSSSGLRGFMLMMKKFKNKKGGLIFCCLNKEVAGVFDMTGMSGFMTVKDSLDEAIKAL